jgi:predicted metal-dependent HD superfamily phosphohydrolase
MSEQAQPQGPQYKFLQAQPHGIDTISLWAHCTRMPVDVIECAFELYSKGTRYYHTWEHAWNTVAQVVRTQIETPFAQPREALVAALFHDAVYAAGFKDNEKLSVHEAKKALEGQDIDLDAVAALIMATTHHFEGAFAEHSDEAKFLDCDLAGFAAPWPVFIRLQELIDKEMINYLTEERLYVRRAAFLKGVLEKEFIFNTARVREAWETMARSNITRMVEVYGKMEEERVTQDDDGTDDSGEQVND